MQTRTAASAPRKRRAASGRSPSRFATIDANNDGKLSADEMLASTKRMFDKVPNLDIPEMNGIGAQEICVTTAMGVCDFISAMDTFRECPNGTAGTTF